MLQKERPFAQREGTGWDGGGAGKNHGDAETPRKGGIGDGIGAGSTLTHQAWA
jgi:hypothetical protein